MYNLVLMAIGFALIGNALLTLKSASDGNEREDYSGAIWQVGIGVVLTFISLLVKIYGNYSDQTVEPTFLRIIVAVFFLSGVALVGAGLLKLKRA